MFVLSIHQQPRSLQSKPSGQAIIEYLLVLSFAIALSLLVIRGIRGASDQGILVFGGQLEKNLKTGRTPAALGWKN